MPQTNKEINTSSFLPNTTQTPDVILDKIMAFISGNDFKVLMYIARRTYGFRKESDNISLKQIVEGITTKEGKRLDYGTGLKKSSATDSLKKLSTMGVIIAKRNSSLKYGNLPTTYSINLEFDVTPLVRVSDKASPGVGQPLVRVSDTQHPELQHPDSTPSLNSEKFKKNVDNLEAVDDKSFLRKLKSETRFKEIDIDSELIRFKDYVLKKKQTSSDFQKYFEGWLNVKLGIITHKHLEDIEVQKKSERMGFYKNTSKEVPGLFKSF